MVSYIEDGECSRAQGKHRRGIMLDIFHVTGILAGLIMLVGIGKFMQATPKKEKAETALESHAKMTKEFESQPGHKWTKKEKEQIAGLKKEYEDEKAEAESIEKKGWACVLNAIFLGFLAFFHVEAGGSSFMERVFGGFVSVHLIWKVRGVRVGILKRN